MSELRIRSSPPLNPLLSKEGLGVVIPFLIILSFILFSPLPVFADHGGTHLIHCATHWNFIGPPPPNQAPSTAFCTICDLFVLLQTGFNFIWLYLSVPIATVMLLYGGFLMVLPSFTGNSNQVSKGRGVLLHTVMGLAIVFFAWIGVDSILKIMGAQQTGNFGPWNEIKCTAPTVQAPLGLPGGPGPGVGPGITPAFDGGPKLTEQGGRNFLNQAGIGTKPACPPQVTTNCVNLSNIRQGTLQTAVDTKNACNCEVFVTGGTEGGHAGGTFSHGNGDKVDVRRNPQLDAYIQQNYRSAGRRPGDGAALYINDKTGAVYAKESSHWDVLGWDVDRRTTQ